MQYVEKENTRTECGLNGKALRVISLIERRMVFVLIPENFSQSGEVGVCLGFVCFGGLFCLGFFHLEIRDIRTTKLKVSLVCSSCFSLTHPLFAVLRVCCFHTIFLKRSFLEQRRHKTYCQSIYRSIHSRNLWTTCGRQSRLPKAHSIQ